MHILSSRVHQRLNPLDTVHDIVVTFLPSEVRYNYIAFQVNQMTLKGSEDDEVQHLHQQSIAILK